MALDDVSVLNPSETLEEATYRRVSEFMAGTAQGVSLIPTSLLTSDDFENLLKFTQNKTEEARTNPKTTSKNLVIAAHARSLFYAHASPRYLRLLAARNVATNEYELQKRLSALTTK